MVDTPLLRSRHRESYPPTANPLKKAAPQVATECAKTRNLPPQVIVSPGARSHTATAHRLDDEHHRGLRRTGGVRADAAGEHGHTHPLRGDLTVRRLPGLRGQDVALRGHDRGR